MARPSGAPPVAVKPDAKTLQFGVTLKGVLETWEEGPSKERSFGFIRPESGGLEVFATKVQLIGKVEPTVGSEVSFALLKPTAKQDGEEGGLKAQWWRIVSASSTAQTSAAKEVAEEIEEAPSLMSTFGQLWGLKPETMKWLSRFPDAIQQQVAEQFDPGEGMTNMTADILDKKIRSYTYEVKSSYR